MRENRLRTKKDVNIMIGKNIEILRKNKKMTQQEVAGRTGISQTYVSRIEKGTRNVDPYELIKICAVLGCKIEELIDNHVYYCVIK